MLKKILVVSLICLLIFAMFSCKMVVYAGYAEDTVQSSNDGSRSTTESTSEGGSSLFSGANDFVKDGEKQVRKSLNEEKLKETSNSIYNILLAIAMVIAVAVGSFLGIKFMTSSVDEQAKIKELLVPYVAGCIVVFGAIGIWKLAVTTFAKF